MAWTEKYVSVAGSGAHDGTSAANEWTLAEAIAAYAAGQRLNVKAGTYANTTTDRTFATAGTTTAPIWWRGYNAAIGDLDADFSTAKPAITFTTGRFIATGGFQYFSNLNISGAQVTNGQLRLATTTLPTYFDRIRVECTAANSAGRAFHCSVAAPVTITRSFLKSTSSAEVMLIDTAASQTTLVGNALEGGAHGVICNVSGAQLITAFNAFRSIGGDAFRFTDVVRFWSLFNSVSSPTSDGFEFTVAPTIANIIGTIMAGCGGYGIKNSTGGNLATFFRLANDFYNNTSGTEFGLGDSVSFSEVSESSSPFTSSSDLSLVTGAVARQLFPGLFENESFTGYGALGAVGPVAAGGSAGMLYHTGGA